MHIYIYIYIHCIYIYILYIYIYIHCIYIYIYTVYIYSYIYIYIYENMSKSNADRRNQESGTYEPRPCDYRRVYNPTEFVGDPDEPTRRTLRDREVCRSRQSKMGKTMEDPMKWQF